MPLRAIRHRTPRLLSVCLHLRSSYALSACSLPGWPAARALDRLHGVQQLLEDHRVVGVGATEHNDQHGVYRGLYEWDGPEHAEHYAHCLWWVLALGCDPRSIRYRVLPGLRRDTLLASP